MIRQIFYIVIPTCFLLTGCATTQSNNSQPNPLENITEIIPKEDAKMMFNMSLESWKKNLEQGRSQGIFDYEQANEFEYSMFMRMPKLGAIHIVTPSYNEKNINVPWKVTIKVIFQGWVETSFRV